MTPDGVRVAYRDYGGAGLTSCCCRVSAETSRPSTNRARTGHRWRIVTMDPRGIGQSGESETITAADLVVDVETVVEALRLHHPAVVGHSLGGIVAGCYGTVHPDVPVVSIDGFDAGSPASGPPRTGRRSTGSSTGLASAFGP